MSSGAERRVADDVGQDVDRERQVLVEHLDVVAGVFLRGERVELAADRIDRLGDVFGGPRRVPLNSMCSTKCAMPPRSAVSWRDPRVSQTPMLTERTCVIRSVRMRRPLSRTSRTIGEFDKVKLAAGTRARRASDVPQSVEREGITSRSHYNTHCSELRQAAVRSRVGKSLKRDRYRDHRRSRISPSSSGRRSRRRSTSAATSASARARSSAGSTAAASPTSTR